MRKKLLLAGAVFAPALMAAGGAAAGGAAAQQTDADDVDAITVYGKASRLPEDLTTIPGSVTVLDSAAINTQEAISSDLGRILAMQTPGMSISSNDGNNFSQTLRGRKPAFFIDGMPQSAALRGGGRDLRIIHPSVLERVEIINGATSIYGLGGSGGVVNYVTKSPTSEKLELYSEFGFASSLTNVDSDSFEYNVSQSASQRIGRFSYIGNITYQSRGLYYDPDGDPIPPDPYGQTGIADMRELSLFGKVGYEITPKATIELMALNYDSQVNTDYTVGQGSYEGGVKSIAVPKEQNNIVVGPVAFDFLGDRDPYNDNFLTSADFTLVDFLGGSLNIKGYYKEADMVWRHLDWIALAPTAGGFPPNGSQLRTTNEKYGVNAIATTPFGMNSVSGTILWGVDYSVDKTEETLVDGRPRTSELTQTGVAGFVQGQIDLTDWLHLRTGVRYDTFDLEIPDFEALDYFSADVAHTVLGADLDYNSWTGNVGAVVDLSDEFSVFASWSTGFSIGNVMRSISALRPSVPTSGVTYDVNALGLFIEPVSVTSIEGGVRYDNDVFNGSVTGFVNKSDLGASFDPVTFATTRAPEKVWGLEAVANLNFTEWLRIGATGTWMDSKTDEDNDGDFEGPLDFTRVPPPLLNTYAEADLGKWTFRIQTTSMFDESRFSAPFGNFQRDVEGFTVIDVSVAGKVGPGTLSFGVENATNNNYTPFLTQMGCPTVTGLGTAFFDAFCNTAPVGARASMRYSVTY